MRIQRLVPFLLAVSCGYVGLPWVLFLLGWFRWYVAWPALLGWIGAISGVVAKSAQGRDSEFFPSLGGGSFFSRLFGGLWSGHGLWQAGLWAIVALVLVSLSGAGGLGLQEGDYFKHNAVLKHLIESGWPVWIPTDRGLFPLVYYLGWYLPAAGVGKVWGWEAANVFIFIWTYVGVVLALAWFALLVGRCHWVVLGIFFFFSAPDVLGAALFKLIGWDPGPPLPPPVPDNWGINWYALRWWNWELRWWAGPYTWNYCCQMELLFWVPQQALGAWLCTSMILAALWWPWLQGQRWILVPLALSALWSPLVTLGLGPLVVASFFRSAESHRNPYPLWTQWFDWPNGLALGLMGLGGIYYAAHFAWVPFSNDPRAEFRILGFDEWPMLMYIFRLICFWIVDIFSIAGLILLVRPPRKSSERLLFRTALIVLVGLTLCRYGLNNDLAMRVSMPWLFVLAVLLAKRAIRRRLPPIRRCILWGALALMATTPVAEVYRHVCEMRRQGRWINIPNVAQIQSLEELNRTCREKSGNDFFIRQYIGSPKAAFFRYLAAQSDWEP